jgi:hypothetical protein
MSLQLPEELREALSMLGFDWPDADEDKLNAMGRAWNEFAATLNGLITEAERHAQSVWSTNKGMPIDAFQRSWTGAEAPVTNLKDAAEAAAQIALAMGVAAEIVRLLKVKVIAEVAAFARVLAIAIAAAKTPWTAAGAAAAVIIARMVAVAAIDAAFEYAINRLLNG